VTTNLLDDLRADRALTVVRAPELPDAAALCRALAAGGIRTVELTFTTPGVLGHLERAACATSSPRPTWESAPSAAPRRPATR
jgi:2-dehydro-3-deoxyphosphogluconate aldolase/(4S)-4-hydroxy-2-oxoglutarate aldolase